MKDIFKTREEMNNPTFIALFCSFHNKLSLVEILQLSLTSRPEALRKMCQTHSVQIVKHCNNGLNVQNKHALDLVTSLTALLLQVNFRPKINKLDMT